MLYFKTPRMLRIPRAAATYVAAALALALVLPGSAPAVPSWDVPEKVSQGHAFIASGKDNAPFSADVEWRGKKIPVAISN